MGKFIITKRTNGEYQFNLKADNGQVILSSEGYSGKSGCHAGMESVQKMPRMINATNGFFKRNFGMVRPQLQIEFD